MASVEDGTERRREPTSREITRRGNQLQMRLARVEMVLDGLIAVDRLLVLNQALSNVLYDDAGGR
jgi:hypothetical protein